MTGTDLQLALAPEATYRRLVSQPVRGSWRAVFERVVFIAFVTGSLITMSSARRVPFGLVLMGIVCWSFVPLIQLAVGAIVIGRVRTRRISVPRALELLFLGHLPWSLWLVTLTGLYVFTDLPLPLYVRVLSLLIPAAWTWWILSAFGRTVLGCSPRRARQLTWVHQAMTWMIFSAYVVLVSGIWARVLAVIGR